MAPPRVLCIMGSGETAPTMVSIHAELLARLGERSRAVFLDTPFGFQENADDLVGKTQRYFRKNVGHDLELASFRNAETITEIERETALNRIADADYVFAGPGSPSYALNQWRSSAVPDLLREKLRTGGIVTFASAAAVTLGAVAIPVYEIYKVGQAAHWLEGLNLMSTCGLDVAVVPHYNNAEGGGHDTRFCYMGERRLRHLESMMPQPTWVLGVDEHTALLIDLEAATATVRGRGRVVVRRDGQERVHENGEVLALGDLLLSPAASPAVAPPAPVFDSETSDTPFAGIAAAERERFEQGIDRGDVDAMVTAVLALDTAIAEWATDTLDSDERDVARALLRRCVVRLGDSAREGVADPRERVAPFVDAMLELRGAARADRRFADADRVRDLLAACGVEVRDTSDGVTWNLTEHRRGATAPV